MRSRLNRTQVNKKERTHKNLAPVLYFFFILVIILFIILLTIYGVILINITINSNLLPANPINPYYIIHITHNYSTNIRNIMIYPNIYQTFLFIFRAKISAPTQPPLKIRKFPHIQGKKHDNLSAYTNYDIFNEIELLLKNPYIWRYPIENTI